MDDQTTIRSSGGSIAESLKPGPAQDTLERNGNEKEQGTAAEQAIVAAADQDPKNPKNWSKSKKWSNFGIVFINAFIGYFTSSIYMPAIQNLQEYFGTDLTVMNATIALYVAAMALAPLFWSPLSERIGRRPVYLISMLMYTVTTIICGVSKNIVLFFVMRILQGVFSSAGMTVGGGTIADLFAPHERGRTMSLLTLGTVTGPAVGPLVGGYVSKYLGWRWIFYICTIIGGALLLLNALILRESLYRPERVKPKTMKDRIAYLKFDPLRGLMLLLRPDVVLTCIPLSVSFGWFYFLVAILSPTYTQIYHFDQGSMGLLYLTGGIGNIIGAIIAGQVSDLIYLRLRAKSVDGTVKVEGRLIPVLFCVPVIVAGALMYGWFLHARLHWFVPLVGYFLMSLGTMYGNVTGTSYLVEAYLPVAASAVATANFARNMMAMVFTLVSASVRNGLGDGWSYTVAALTSLICYAICIPCLYFYGERIRNAKPWWSRNKQEQ